jgi:hypothetical protein
VVDAERQGEGEALPERDVVALPLSEPLALAEPDSLRVAPPREGEALPERDAVALPLSEPLALAEPDSLRVAPPGGERVGGPPLTLPAKDPEGEPVVVAERQGEDEALPQGEGEPLRLPDCDADGEREGEPVAPGEGETRAEAETVAEAEAVGVRLPATRTAPNRSSVGATAKDSGRVTSAGSASTAVPEGASRRVVAVKVEGSIA